MGCWIEKSFTPDYKLVCTQLIKSKISVESTDNRQRTLDALNREECTLLITEILARNARVYGKEVALIERDPGTNSRREITWEEFDAEANRVANALIAKGIQKGDKVIHLMMNCIEWLPAYFGILRTGAWAVPLNFRFSADDIKLCNEIAEAKAFVFGEEFIDRVEQIKPDLDKTVATYVFVGPEDKRPAFAEPYTALCWLPLHRMHRASNSICLTVPRFTLPRAPPAPPKRFI